MKFLVQIILVLFLFVQTAPTLICLMDNEKSISLDMADEDENSKEEKEFKVEFVFNSEVYAYFLDNTISKEISSDYLIKDYKFNVDVDVIPPKV